MAASPTTPEALAAAPPTPEALPAQVPESERRRLKRRNSREVDDIFVEQRLTVRGHWVKEPIVLPVATLPSVPDVDMVAIRCGASWLHQILRGFSRGPGIIIKAVIADLKKAARSDGQAHQAAMVAQATRGRAELFVETSDDDDTDEEVEEGEPGPSRGPGRRPGRGPGLRCVTIQGVSVHIAWCGKATYAKADQENLRNLITILTSVGQADIERHRAATREAARHPVGDDLEPGDKGRVRWDAGSRSWTVLYRDDRGARRSTRRNLSVDVEDLAGEPKSQEEFAAARRCVLRRARKLWNEMDKSSEERFAIDQAVGFF